MENSINNNLFPCKSINLLRFLEANGLSSKHKYTDIKDGRDCWLFIKTEKLDILLTEWTKRKPRN